MDAQDDAGSRGDHNGAGDGASAGAVRLPAGRGILNALDIPSRGGKTHPHVLPLGLHRDLHRHGIVGAWRREQRLGRLGTVVGWCGVAVGIAGLILHLRSQFFTATTLHNLVYSAPFVAPLAFTGLGLLLLANRMVPEGTQERPQWVVFLALGGFLDNFVLSLTDHAQNGFFNALEWVPVFASALAVGFLLVALFRPLTRGFARACWLVLALQVVTGVAGFALHVWFDVHGPARRLELDFLYGAPAFAPLLFADLAVLAAIGLTGLRALPEV
jgi:hypothetical protein